MTFLLEVFLLVTLPLGTAILVGSLGERLGGELVSYAAAIGGLCMGIYFWHKALEIIIIASEAHQSY